MRRDARAFTLIEVMVALAIVAITLGAGLRAAGALSDNAQRLGQVSVAQWCADNQLTGLKLGHQFPDTGDGDFSCDELGVTYAGKLIVRPTPNPNFRRVEVHVFDADGYTIVSVTTVLGRL